MARKAHLDLEAFMPYRLSVASNAVSDRIARQYQARFGLRIPEWRLMAVLGEGKPLSQRELVDATRMDKVTISRASATLVDRGLVTREANDTDRRSHRLVLTAAGESLYDEIAPVALAMEQALLDCLSPSEQILLGDMLLRLRDAADQVQPN
jgi:DNA-binding MarR family transcriptional regulator